MTISKKLYLSVGSISTLLIIMAVVFVINIEKGHDSLSRIGEYPEIQTILGSRTIDHYKWAETLAVDTIMLGKEFTKSLDPTQCDLGKWYYSFKPPAELEKEWKAIEEPHKRLHATASKIIAALKEGRADLARKIYQEETSPALKELQEALTEMRIGVKKLMDHEINYTKSKQNTLLYLTLTVYAIIILLLIFSSIFFLIRPIKWNLSRISDWVEKIASGNLLEVNNINSKDEIGLLAEKIEGMVSNLRGMIKNIKDGSHHIASSSEELSSSANGLNEGANQQTSQ
ncbi:MAG: CZB domain-containing protein, partial [Thermodesulfovibrionales bacterium]